MGIECGRVVLERTGRLALGSAWASALGLATYRTHPALPRLSPLSLPLPARGQRVHPASTTHIPSSLLPSPSDPALPSGSRVPPACPVPSQTPKSGERPQSGGDLTAGSSCIMLVCAVHSCEIVLFLVPQIRSLFSHSTSSECSQLALRPHSAYT